MKNSLLIFIVFLIYLCSFRLAYAEEIIEITPLSFGTIVLLNNDETHEYKISFAGDVNADPAYIILTPGQPAEYLLTEFLTNTQLTISILVPDTTTSLAGSIDNSTSQFTIDNHHTASSTITTNSLGEATINIGANLTSSGSGFYTDATYFNNMTILVDY